jgi:uncharacterized protein
MITCVVRARLYVLAITVAALASGGCGSLLRSHDVSHSGLQTDEDRLRHMLVSGQAPTAFERMKRQAPADEMLHALYHGVLAYHAGEYAESARVLDIAAHIADERMTKSMSRAAFSLISNDLILEYEPGRTERLMIPYYAALARLRMGDAEGAAVEARRLSGLLQRYADEGVRVEAALRATLRYVAGAIFEAAGEHGDADVAYRNAFAADSTLALLHRNQDAVNGSVLIILEQGFVAHRVEQGLAVMLLPEEVEAIAHGNSEDRAAVSAFVAARIIDRAAYSSSLAGRDRRSSMLLHVPAPERSVVPRTRRRTVCTAGAAVADTTRPPGQAAAVRTARDCTEQEEEIGGLPYLLKVAWPVYVSGRGVQRARAVAGAEEVSFTTAADISRGVIADFEAERALIAARTIARGTVKLALAKGAERKLEEKHETASRIVGLLGNISNVLTERADTRSWHLLPTAISIARVELPGGSHEVAVAIGNAVGGTGLLSTGPITVQPGTLTIVPVRAW